MYYVYFINFEKNCYFHIVFSPKKKKYAFHLLKSFLSVYNILVFLTLLLCFFNKNSSLNNFIFLSAWMEHVFSRLLFGTHCYKTENLYLLYIYLVCSHLKFLIKWSWFFTRLFLTSWFPMSSKKVLCSNFSSLRYSFLGAFTSIYLVTKRTVLTLAKRRALVL